MPASLCICICTYRRPILLERCLQSLREHAPEWPVLVVDNAGEADCQQLCEDFGVAYVHAPETGLSHARNVGYRSSKADWIFYLDDDATVRATTLEAIAAHLSNEDLAGIGGRFEHYYDQPPPAWLEMANGTGMAPVQASEPILLQNGQKLFGGIMVLRREAIDAVGGFNPDLGMQGKNFGYGEESDLIFRMQTAAYQLLYDPAIVIDHLYSPRKYSLGAHLKMSYQQGRADRLKGLAGPKNLVALLLLWMKLLFVTVPLTLGRWVFRHPEWKWQNAFMIVASKFTDSWGYFRAGE